MTTSRRPADVPDTSLSASAGGPPKAPALPRVGIVFLLFAALLPNLVWIALDHRPWPWDQAWYGEVSVDLWFYLTHSFHEWARTMLHGLEVKPPAIVWLGQLFVPFGAWLGSIENALLLCVVLAQTLTLLLVYRVGRLIAPGSYLIPALGVAMIAASQSFVALSHELLVEPLQATAVAWIVFVALRSPQWPGPRTVLHTAAALLLAALTKASTRSTSSCPAFASGGFCAGGP